MRDPNSVLPPGPVLPVSTAPLAGCSLTGVMLLFWDAVLCLARPLVAIVGRGWDGDTMSRWVLLVTPRSTSRPFLYAAPPPGVSEFPRLPSPCLPPEAPSSKFPMLRDHPSLAPSVPETLPLPAIDPVPATDAVPGPLLLIRRFRFFLTSLA